MVSQSLCLFSVDDIDYIHMYLTQLRRFLFQTNDPGADTVIYTITVVLVDEAAPHLLTHIHTNIFSFYNTLIFKIRCFMRM